MALSLTVVAAVSRAERITAVLENHARQRQPARLVLVLNGAARNESMSPGHQVLRCEGGTPAKPRNVGLDWVKRNGGGMVAFWDDDDYYGHGYLTEIAAALEGRPRRVVGKVVRFAEFDDGVVLFTRRQGPAFLGGTIAGWADELPPIPDLPCHEDHEWCRLLEREGFELRTLSGAHYCYNRKGGTHAWRSTRTQMLHSYGPGFDLGPVSPAIAGAPLSRVTAFIPRTTLEDVESELIQNLLARPIDAPTESELT